MGDASTVRQIEPAFFHFTFFLKIIRPSALPISRLSTGGSRNLIGSPPLRLQCFSDLFYIGDLSVVHGFALAVNRTDRRSNSQSPGLLPFCALKRQFALLDRRPRARFSLCYSSFPLFSLHD
ncbi:hypothetical protein HAX54_012753 [Datura stramonium]|uniref:Uncharacterized protein n=1 Tax=Datura stramonium TaxID=4076 RepID=A0ABS8RXW8_DATST|nr:hypothetical protein [Datura stramonium]